MSKKIILEDLLEDLRALGEQYELDENEPDVFLIKISEVNAFAEDLVKVTKEFLEKELALTEEEDEDDELDEDEFQEIFWLDDDDELE